MLFHPGLRKIGNDQQLRESRAVEPSNDGKPINNANNTGILFQYSCSYTIWITDRYLMWDPFYAIILDHQKVTRVTFSRTEHTGI
jgi:hypothetical protein